MKRGLSILVLFLVIGLVGVVSGEHLSDGCEEDWNCESSSYTKWGDCDQETKKFYRYRKNCIDINECGTEEDKPRQEKGCSTTQLQKIEDGKKYQIDKQKADKLKKTGNYCEIVEGEINIASYKLINNINFKIMNIEGGVGSRELNISIANREVVTISENNPKYSGKFTSKLIFIDLLSIKENSARISLRTCISDTCDQNWHCEDWVDSCSEDNMMKRECFDINECEKESNKPEDIKECPDLEAIERENLDNINKDIIIELSEDNIKLTSKLELIEENGIKYVVTSKGNVKINHRFKKFLIEGSQIEEIKLSEENGLAVYNIPEVVKVKLFFIFSIDSEVLTQYDVETGKIISSSRPWWSFLASGFEPKEIEDVESFEESVDLDNQEENEGIVSDGSFGSILRSGLDRSTTEYEEELLKFTSCLSEQKRVSCPYNFPRVTKNSIGNYELFEGDCIQIDECVDNFLNIRSEYIKEHKEIFRNNKLEKAFNTCFSEFNSYKYFNNDVKITLMGANFENCYKRMLGIEKIKESGRDKTEIDGCSLLDDRVRKNIRKSVDVQYDISFEEGGLSEQDYVLPDEMINIFGKLGNNSDEDYIVVVRRHSSIEFPVTKLGNNKAKVRINGNDYQFRYYNGPKKAPARIHEGLTIPTGNHIFAIFDFPQTNDDEIMTFNCEEFDSSSCGDGICQNTFIENINNCWEDCRPEFNNEEFGIVLETDSNEVSSEKTSDCRIDTKGKFVPYCCEDEESKYYEYSSFYTCDYHDDACGAPTDIFCRQKCDEFGFNPGYRSVAVVEHWLNEETGQDISPHIGFVECVCRVCDIA